MSFSEIISPFTMLAQGAGAGGGAEGLFGSTGFIIPLMMMVGLYYFMILRPEQSKKKDLETMLQGLKKDDPVITIGGICGYVANSSPGSKYVTIRIDESKGVKIRILRSHISQVGSHDETDEKPGEKKDKETA